MAGDVYDAPNQQAVRADGSGPGVDEEAPGPEVEDQGRYDPGDFTIDEVKAYVDAHPDDADDVYEAELQGKARSTLLSWFGEED